MPIPRQLLHPPRWVTRLLHAIYLKVGYRGLALVTFGSLWILVGVSSLTSAGVVPPDPNLIHTKLPIFLRFAVWSILGVYAFVMGVIRNQLRPTGFAALFIGPFERFLSYTYALFTTASLAEHSPEWRYLTGLALYLVLTVTVVLFSAWPEPPDEVIVVMERPRR
jgi:hypothetical protein